MLHLIFCCQADHVPDWQPRILYILGIVEARSVNVNAKNPRVHRLDKIRELELRTDLELEARFMAVSRDNGKFSIKPFPGYLVIQHHCI